MNGKRPCFLILALLIFNPAISPESPQQSTPSESAHQSGQASPQEQGGMSTADTHAAVLDSENRPITAGGFVDHGPIIFKNVAAQAGLATWRHVMGTPEKRYILETVGSGVALLDYDNDGWLDIYLVNGSTYEAMAGKAEPPHAALFHNNRDGTFTNVAAKA